MDRKELDPKDLEAVSGGVKTGDKAKIATKIPEPAIKPVVKPVVETQKVRREIPTPVDPKIPEETSTI